MLSTQLQNVNLTVAARILKSTEILWSSAPFTTFGNDRITSEIRGFSTVKHRAKTLLGPWAFLENNFKITKTHFYS